MLPSSTKYRLAEDVLSVETNGENILMDYGSGKYFGVRGAVSVVMEPLRNGADLTQMIDLVSTHFKVPRTQAEDDLRAILKRLVDAGLVTQTEQV